MPGRRTLVCLALAVVALVAGCHPQQQRDTAGDHIPVIRADKFGPPVEGVAIALDYAVRSGSAAALRSRREVDFYTYLWNRTDDDLTFCTSFTDYDLRVLDASGAEVSDRTGWLDQPQNAELASPGRTHWVTLRPGELIRVHTRFLHPQYRGLRPGTYTAQVELRTDQWTLRESDMAPGDRDLKIWRPARYDPTQKRLVGKRPVSEKIRVHVP